MRALLLVALVACKSDRPAKQPPKRVTAGPPIIAKTGQVELLADDGAPLTAFTIAEYGKQLAGSDRAVIATQFPATLSPLAGAGINLYGQGKNVSWYVDGDPEHGFVFAFDENANGDLRDDPVRKFAHAGDTWELALTVQAPAALGDDPVPAPVRIRFRDGEFHIQAVELRRGTLHLQRGLMPFAIIGDNGQFGLQQQFLVFDLDRDGKMDFDSLDNAELIHVFEDTITLDDASYRFTIAPDGSQLTLQPLAETLPPRPALATGTPAPELAVTDLDGKPVRLSSLRGQLVLLDFWATDCNPCVKALPRIAELRARYHDKGFEVMAIASDSPDVRETLGANRTGIEAIDEPAHTQFRIDRYPNYFLVGRDGIFLCAHCKLDRVEELVAEQLK
jgi:thiol-disulfide isomerase/thioredoxin